MRKALKIMIVLALLAVPSAALAASNTSQPQAINNCQGLKLKPQRITLSCGDGNTWLGKLKWSSWTNTQAVANGNLHGEHLHARLRRGPHPLGGDQGHAVEAEDVSGSGQPGVQAGRDRLQGHTAQGRAAEVQLQVPGAVCPGAY